MSEQTTENGPSSPVEPLRVTEGSGDTGTPAEAPQEPETFPREYVERLRRENAEARVGAKRSEALAARLVAALAAQTGRLADASDLPYSDDLLDDEGLPDGEKVRAAVADLIERKPHLASTRPVGDVGQGVRGDTTPTVSLADLLRSGAG